MFLFAKCPVLKPHSKYEENIKFICNVCVNEHPYVLIEMSKVLINVKIKAFQNNLLTAFEKKKHSFISSLEILTVLFFDIRKFL